MRTEIERLWTVNWLGDSKKWVTATVTQTLYDWRSKWTVVCFNPGRASEVYEAMGGQVQVISRPFWPDEDIMKHFTKPQQWIDHISKHDRRLWHYTANEAGNSDDLFNWLADCIELTVGTDIKLVVWNGNIGHPTDVKVYERPAFLRLIEWCHKEKHRVIFGIHEGFGALPTSGFIGGAPNHPAHADFTKIENWPGREAVHTPGFTKWHSGRFINFVTPILKNRGWSIRVGNTEMAAGTTGDILSFLQGLPVTPRYGGVVGNWRSCGAYWKTIRPDWSAAEFYAHSNLYLAQTVYDLPEDCPIILEFLAYFCGWDHEGQDLHWMGESVTPNGETAPLHALHEAFATGQYISPIPAVVNAQPPAEMPPEKPPEEEPPSPPPPPTPPEIPIPPAPELKKYTFPVTVEVTAFNEDDALEMARAMMQAGRSAYNFAVATAVLYPLLSKVKDVQMTMGVTGGE